MNLFQFHLYEIFSPHVRRIEPIFHRKDIKLNQVMHWFIRVSNSWTSKATKEWFFILSLCKGSRRNIWLCVMIGDAKTFARGAKILTLSAKNLSSLLILWSFSIELDKQQGGLARQWPRWTYMLDTMVDLKSSKGDSNEKMSKLEDGQTKDGPTRRFSVTDFWKRLPVDQDEADSIGSRKHVVKDAKLVLQLNIFQFLQICFMAV